jgi:TPR repeat protein
MMHIAVSHAVEMARRVKRNMLLAARPIAYALLTFGLAGTQSAIADCDPAAVPTIDSGSPTDAALRWNDSAEGSGAQERVSGTGDATVSENNYILNRLGIMYARGRGVPKSSRLATKLFRQLAMDGYTPAMVNLGTLYERGTAGRREHRQAYAWIRAALALGVPKEDYDATLFKLGMIAARLGAAHTPSAERLALAIVDSIGDRCRRLAASYEDTVALSSAP